MRFNQNRFYGNRQGSPFSVAAARGRHCSRLVPCLRKNIADAGCLLVFNPDGRRVQRRRVSHTGGSNHETLRSNYALYKFIKHSSPNGHFYRTIGFWNVLNIEWMDGLVNWWKEGRMAWWMDDWKDVFIHLYSASRSAHQAEALPERDTLREDTTLGRTISDTWLTSRWMYILDGWMAYCGSLVDSSPYVRRVVGSNPALAAT